jgi:hypothetical protein
MRLTQWRPAVVLESNVKPQMDSESLSNEQLGSNIKTQEHFPAIVYCIGFASCRSDRITALCHVCV